MECHFILQWIKNHIFWCLNCFIWTLGVRYQMTSFCCVSLYRWAQKLLEFRLSFWLGNLPRSPLGWTCLKSWQCPTHLIYSSQLRTLPEWAESHTWIRPIALHHQHKVGTESFGHWLWDPLSLPINQFILIRQQYCEALCRKEATTTIPLLEDFPSYILCFLICLLITWAICDIWK